MSTAPTPIINITTPVPISSDPDTFETRADLAWTELPIAISGVNAAAQVTYANAVEVATTASAASALFAAAFGSTKYFALSNSSVSLTPGVKSVHLTNDTGGALASGDKSFADGWQVLLVRASNPEARMSGAVSGWDGIDDFTLTVSGTENIVGSGGPFIDWMVLWAGFAVPGTTAADIWAMVSSLVAMTPAAWRAALVPRALTDGATVTPNGLQGLDFTWPIGGNRTLGAITNTYPGARGTITCTQDATGNRILAVHASWKRRGGLGVLSTTALAVDEIPYEVKAVDSSGTATRTIYDVIRDPS